MASEVVATGGCMSFLCFIKYSHPYFLGIVPTTPAALFLLCILLYSHLLNVHVLLDFDSSKIKQALGSGMMHQINDLFF